jgi:hypothetical protein
MCMTPPAGRQAAMSDLSRTIGGRAFGCPVGAGSMPPSAGRRSMAWRGAARALEHRAGSRRVPWARRRIARSRTPTPPCTDRAMGLLVPVASNPIRFSKPVSCSGRTGRIFPLGNDPFLFDRRVPGRKFVIAGTDRTQSAPGRLSRWLRPGCTMPAPETRLFRTEPAPARIPPMARQPIGIAAASTLPAVG